MLKINNLYKTYGDKTVISDLSFSCPDRGVIAIMGASGIGKTTLLNIIAGLVAFDSGEVCNSFKKTSYKFQEPRLLDWLTAKENISSVMPKGGDADKWLEAVGLLDSAEKYPSELSGGMQQRVSLARALAYGGDLLLLDEPFSAVDADTKQRLIALIKDYSKNNAVILVTHDLAEANDLDAEIITVK